MLPYSLIGEDYLRYYSNGPPDVAWDDKFMQYFVKWNCNTARLGFAFPDTGRNTTHSTLELDKMDKVIEIFDSYNVKVILDNHNIGGDHSGYFGSEKYFANWRQLAQHYQFDNRIEGFNIFNEPTKNNWAAYILSKEQFIDICGLTIDAIREHDAQRKIFFPVLSKMGIGFDDIATVKNTLDSYNIMQRGNVILDVLHPYYWETSWNQNETPEQTVQNYVNSYLAPYVSTFGAARCWIGETFAFPEGAGYTKDKQTRFLAEMLRACKLYNMGVQVWAFFGKIAAQEQAMIDSGVLGYVPIPEPEPPTPEPEPPEPPPEPVYKSDLAELLQSLVDFIQQIIESLMGEI